MLQGCVAKLDHPHNCRHRPGSCLYGPGRTACSAPAAGLHHAHHTGLEWQSKQLAPGLELTTVLPIEMLFQIIFVENENQMTITVSDERL